jgi:hypothetical protein
MKERLSFLEIGVNIMNGATAKEAEVAYHAALKQWMLQIIEDHPIRVVDLKCKKVVRKKKKAVLQDPFTPVGNPDKKEPEVPLQSQPVLRICTHKPKKVCNHSHRCVNTKIHSRSFDKKRKAVGFLITAFKQRKIVYQVLSLLQTFSESTCTLYIAMLKFPCKEGESFSPASGKRQVANPI